MRSSLLLLAAVLSLLTSACGRQAPPGDAEQLFDGFFREWIAFNPDDASQLGLTPQMGYAFDKGDLTDGSPKYIDRCYRHFRKYSKWMKGLDRSALTESQQLDAQILEWYLDQMLAGEKFKHHGYVINPGYGVHNTLVTLLTEYHGIGNAQDVRDYLSRLEKIPRRLAQVRGRLALQESKGIRPPAYIIDFADSAMAQFIRPPAAENILYTSLAARLQGLPDLDSAARAQYLRQAEEAIDRKIYPAYLEYLAEVRRARAKADNREGVWKLPDGDAYYRWCLKYHTTTPMTPEEVHEMGLKEVAQLQGQIRALVAGMGMDSSGAFQGMINRYWERLSQRSDAAKFGYPEAEASKAQVIRDYQAIIDRTWARLPQAFALVPRTRVYAQPVPKFKEATAGTYYEPPSLDGGRPGIFYVNQGWMPNKPGMPSLTFHEAIPGHHFQIAIQQERRDNRIFKALLFFTGFGEGWALYAEALAKEQGWFDDDHQRIANLMSLLFRAVRLVVDTGIHAKRWDGQQAYQYFEANSGWASRGEIARYVMWPGQACAYYVGMARIIDLRERARRELGPRFDLGGFHRLATENGTVPLELLEKMVEGHIAKNK